jgi:precorrin-6A/cobalt-precorrin-6A reductase
MRILILGGTTEAFALSQSLAERSGIDVVLSLAGRTSTPRDAGVPTRIGGFGGLEGLSRWLVDYRTELVIDATHPFAAVISRNAAQACATLGLPLLGLRRPPWVRQDGDLWIEVGTTQEAVSALGPEPRRVFLTIGRLELGPFSHAPQHHYLVRTIEPIDDALTAPHVTALRARGPFDEASERSLLEEHRVEVLVTKNSGGPATYGKIAAARALGLPVVIVSRPHKPDVRSVATAKEAVTWIERHGRSP